MAQLEEDCENILAKGYTKCVETSLENEKGCEWDDVKFIVGKEESVFYGIRALFARHSTVFKLKFTIFSLHMIVTNII